MMYQCNIWKVNVCENQNYLDMQKKPPKTTVSTAATVGSKQRIYFNDPFLFSIQCTCIMYVVIIMTSFG